jgi:hypothetical protein
MLIHFFILLIIPFSAIAADLSGRVVSVADGDIFGYEMGSEMMERGIGGGAGTVLRSLRHNAARGNEMSITTFFAKHLDAPLNNQRNSWGAVRRSDGAVILRGWQDKCKRIDGVDRILLKSAGADDRIGGNERREHLAMIAAGTPGYVLMCEAKDPKASPRAIKKFDKTRLFKIDRVEQIDGAIYGFITTTVPI